MNLPIDLISQFAKITNDDTKTKKETTVYGTTVEDNGSIYVKLDGAELLTPVLATADTKPGERVIVMIKNHTATITGNLSSPAARTDDLKEVANATDKIAELETTLAGKVGKTEFETALADKVGKTEFETEQSRIDVLVEDTGLLEESILEHQNDIENLQTNTANIANDVKNLQTNITDITNNIAKLSVDYISEVGSSGVWSYKKWANGNVELWGTYEVLNVECSVLFGGMYRTSSIEPTAFPFRVNNANLTASYESDECGAILWAITTTTTEKPPNYYLICPESTTITSGKINFHIFGTLTT